MDYIIKNPDIYTEWIMSSQYRMEEEWAREQMQILEDEHRAYTRRKKRHLKLKKIKKFKLLNITVRVPIDDDDIPF
jgi:hypothetical protein